MLLGVNLRNPVNLRNLWKSRSHEHGRYGAMKDLVARLRYRQSDHPTSYGWSCSRYRASYLAWL
jgi:hypothetical protein